MILNSPALYYYETSPGATGIMAGYPLDTVKVRIQTQSPGQQRQGTFGTLMRIVKEEKVGTTIMLL